MSLVNVSIVGNVVKPPTQTCFSSGNTKTTLIVAVNNPGKKTEKQNGTADFYKVEAWGKLSDVAHRYIEKGNQVTAVGRLVLDKWQDREGRERTTPVVHAYQISLPPRFKHDQSELVTQAFGQQSAVCQDEFKITEEEEDSLSAQFPDDSKVQF